MFMFGNFFVYNVIIYYMFMFGYKIFVFMMEYYLYIDVW